MPACPVTVYRAGHPDGMSWTLDIGVAQRFAERGRTMYRCTVSDAYDILGVFADRGESEVALRPGGAWRATMAGHLSSHLSSHRRRNSVTKL